MPHIVRPYDNRLQHNSVERNRVDPVLGMTLGEKSAKKQRACATQRITVFGEMTGGIAHDFRNILAIIESPLRVAERSSQEPEKVRACIAGAREGVDRGLKLTSQLLTFVKQDDLDLRARDANELIKNLELFLRDGAGPGIQILLELASDLPGCLIDPSLFSAALLNLVVNARDAMPKGGEVWISTKRIVRTSTSDIFTSVFVSRIAGRECLKKLCCRSSIRFSQQRVRRVLV